MKQFFSANWKFAAVISLIGSGLFKQKPNTMKRAVRQHIRKLNTTKQISHVMNNVYTKNPIHWIIIH